MAQEETQTLIEIQRLLAEIEQTRAEMKTLRDQIRDTIDQNEEYKKLEAEVKNLSEKRAAAKQTLLDDTTYQKLSTELDDFKFKFRDLSEILSAHLVEYYNRTQKTEVTDKDGMNRPLIITAKIGRSGAGPEGTTT